METTMKLDLRILTLLLTLAIGAGQTADAADDSAKAVIWALTIASKATSLEKAKELHDGKLKPGRRDFGRLKGIEVRENEVILGLPMIFDKNNVDHFDF